MDLKKRFDIIQQLGEGSFSKTYHAFDKKLKLEVALKVEKEDKHKKILKFEYEILKHLQDLPHVPRVYEFIENSSKNLSQGVFTIVLPADKLKPNGNNELNNENNANNSGEGLNFIIMELLGKNVANYKKTKSKFDNVLAYEILLQMLDSIEQLHNKGYIHRDIKPTNFVVKEENNIKRNIYNISQNNLEEINVPKIYMVDYGLAKVHLDKHGRSLSPRINTDFRGTLTYASLNAHNKKELSRRDDLWSFFIVILDLLNEKIPWRSCKDDKDDIKKMKEICFANPEKKLLITTTKGKKEIIDILNHLKSLNYQDRPNYNLIRNKLNDLKLNDLNKNQFQSSFNILANLGKISNLNFNNFNYLNNINNNINLNLNLGNVDKVSNNLDQKSNCILFDFPHKPNENLEYVAKDLLIFQNLLENNNQNNMNNDSNLFQRTNSNFTNTLNNCFNYTNNNVGDNNNNLNQNNSLNNNSNIIGQLTSNPILGNNFYNPYNLNNYLYNSASCFDFTKNLYLDSLLNPGGNQKFVNMNMCNTNPIANSGATLDNNNWNNTFAFNYGIINSLNSISGLNSLNNINSLNNLNALNEYNNVNNNLNNVNNNLNINNNLNNIIIPSNSFNGLNNQLLNLENIINKPTSLFKNGNLSNQTNTIDQNQQNIIDYKLNHIDELNTTINKKRKRDETENDLLLKNPQINPYNQQQNQIFIINQFGKNNFTELEKKLLDYLLNQTSQDKPNNNNNNMINNNINSCNNNVNNNIPDKPATLHKTTTNKKENEYNINTDDRLLINSITNKLKPVTTGTINNVLNEIYPSISNNDLLLHMNNFFPTFNTEEINKLLQFNNSQLSQLTKNFNNNLINSRRNTVQLNRKIRSHNQPIFRIEKVNK